MNSPTTSRRHARARTLLRLCGVLAGPAFVLTFTAAGYGRPGYDPRRLPVSSLALGPGGWVQRTNFVLSGAMYCLAALGLAKSPREVTGPAAVSALVAGAGIGLIGSGIFATDPVGDYPPPGPGAEAPAAPTAAGQLHGIFAIPIFAGIPVAALISAGSALRRNQYRWAAYSAGSGITMAVTFARFAKSLAQQPPAAARAGILQRISIAAGLGWLSTLSVRATLAHDIGGDGA